MAIDYRLGTDAQNFETVHSWLTESYWSPGISRERVEAGFKHSTLCLAAYDGDRQVATGRVLSDTTRFAYISDIFVDPDYRGRGIASELIRQLMCHPMLLDVQYWNLGTADAHEVYRKLGFEGLRNPERMMRCYDPPAARASWNR